MPLEPSFREAGEIQICILNSMLNFIYFWRQGRHVGKEEACQKQVS